MRDEFLGIYRDNLSTHSRLFPGMERVLDRLEQTGMPWGIVTNKPAWLTDSADASAAIGLAYPMYRLRRHCGTSQTAPCPTASCV